MTIAIPNLEAFISTPRTCSKGWDPEAGVYRGPEYRPCVADSPALRIELLGGFRVTVGDRALPPTAWRRSKAAGLVKLLALAPGYRLHREQAMDMLWPELAPPAAAANLRKAVHYARRAVDTDEGEELDRLGWRGFSLPPEHLWIDVVAWRAAVAIARRAVEPKLYDDAVELYGDGLLPDDRYEEWTIAYRNELQVEFVALLEELAGLLEARGDIEGANARRPARRRRAAARGRPRVLIRLHALAGRRAEALASYERLRELLATELGIEPSPEAQRLYEEVRAGQTAEPEFTAELWERVGELRMGAGDTPGAVKAFSLALETAETSDVAVRLHRRPRRRLAHAARPRGSRGPPPAAEAQAEDPAERARLVCLRANQAWERGDLDRAEALAEWARDLALQVGDTTISPPPRRRSRSSRTSGATGIGTPSSRSSGCTATTREAGCRRVCSTSTIASASTTCTATGYPRVSRSTHDASCPLAEQAGDVRAQAFAWCLLGESLLLHARFEEAAGCLERSCELHASFGTTLRRPPLATSCRAGGVPGSAGGGRGPAATGVGDRHGVADGSPHVGSDLRDRSVRADRAGPTPMLPHARCDPPTPPQCATATARAAARC